MVEVQEEPEEEEVFLPEGTPMLTVASVELPESAVGPALEFLEFCAAFYKVSGYGQRFCESFFYWRIYFLQLQNTS